MNDPGGFINFINSVKICWNEVPDGDSYPFNIPAIASMDTLSFEKPVTLFCGENGRGKSTLLEGISIALGLNPEGGSRNYTFSVKATHSALHDYLSLRKSLCKPKDSFFVRSDTLFNLITETDNLDDDKRYYGGRSLHQRSHGESILALISHRFGGEGLYILDEPETGLSQSAQIALVCEITRLANLGSQFIIATHSPILLCLSDAAVFEFDDEVHPVDPGESLELIVLRRFLDNPDKVIAEFMSM